MSTKAQIHYFTLSDEQRKEEKLQWFSENRLKDISFENIQPDKNHNWINLADSDFETLLPLCSKDVKLGKSKDAIFELFSLGIATNRDEWVYDFNKDTLKKKVEFFSKFYETEKNRWIKSSKKIPINHFVNRTIKWTEELENYLKKGVSLAFQDARIRISSFRPFLKTQLYYDRIFIHRFYQQENFYPINSNNWVNKSICFHSVSSDHLLSTLASDLVTDLGYLKQGNGGTFTIPFYTYDKQGNQKENISEWGVARFREYYELDKNMHFENDVKKERFLNTEPVFKINRKNIFYYCYAVFTTRLIKLNMKII